MRTKLLVFTLFAISAPLPTNAADIRVPEDHKTIQLAIDAATAGDTIIVAPGTYKERIRLKEDVALKSAGDNSNGKLGLQRAEATIIDGGGDGERPGVAMAQGSTIDGFTVTNVGTYDDALWEKHHATHGEQQAYEHIGELGTPGIGVIGVNCTISHNIVHHIGYTGIAIQGVDGKGCSPHVYRNFCYRNMGGGIGAMLKSTAVIEENACFQNYYAGIGHSNASPTVINNRCYENIRAGIGISEGACPLVRGNKCYKNRRAGIGIRTEASTQPIVDGNECYENDMAGIGTRAKAAPIIRNNKCYKNKLAGIGSRTEATPTIIGNECYENGKAGIGQQGDAVTMLIDNHCHHNKTSGIGFATCKAGRSTLLNNKVVDNALVAVGVNPGWTVKLSGNELARKGGLPPIVMVFAGADVTFTNNVIRGGGVAGIRVAGKVRVENNDFVGTSLRRVGPPNFAIWALPGADVTMIDNQVDSWRHALHASDATVVAIKNNVSNFHNTPFMIQNPKTPANVSGNIAVPKK